MRNLAKRLLTSIVLILLLTLGYYNKYIWLLLLISIAFISFIEFNNLLKKIWFKNPVKKNLISFIAIFYLIFFVFIINNSLKNDVILILSICICSDIGGYIFGKLIGGRKLTKISPNKTISGSIGSFIFSIIPISYFFFYETINQTFEFNYFSLCFLFLLISLICQIGDLFISYFKRKSNVKDTGNILPGHGGLLDRIDGILFAVPFGIFINNII